MGNLYELVKHLETGNTYFGDVQRDSLEFLKLMKETTGIPSQLREIMVQFPDEGFLYTQILALRKALSLNKSDMMREIGYVISNLDNIESSVVESAKYAEEISRSIHQTIENVEYVK